MSAVHLELFSTATSNCEYENKGELYQFHQIGIIYNVSGLTLIQDRIPEEEGRWVVFRDIKKDEITPFAKYVLSLIS